MKNPFTLSKDGTTLEALMDKSITHVTIPEGVTYIGHWAFNECTNLVPVTMPDGVTSIGRGAFQSCTSLRSVNMPESVKNIGEYAFMNSGLTKLDIPDSVDVIGEGAFKDCISLTCVELPKNLTVINSHLFSGCTALTSVSMPGQLTTISKYAFHECFNLKRIALPPSLTTIEDHAFPLNEALMLVTEDDNTHNDFINNYLHGFHNKVKQRYKDELVLEHPRYNEECTSQYAETDDISFKPVIFAYDGSNGRGGMVGPHGEKGFPRNSIPFSFDLPECGDILDMYVNYPVYCKVGGTFNITYDIEHVITCKLLKIIKHFYHHAQIQVEIVKTCHAMDFIKKVDDITLKAIRQSHTYNFKMDRLSLEWQRIDVKGTSISLNSSLGGDITWTFYIYTDVDMIDHVACYYFCSPTSNGDFFFYGDEVLGHHDDRPWFMKTGVIDIPEGMEYLPPGIFQYREDITKLHIPASMKGIEFAAFYHCTALKEILIHSKNINEINISDDTFEGVDVDECRLFVSKGTEQDCREHPVLGQFKNIIPQ